MFEEKVDLCQLGMTIKLRPLLDDQGISLSDNFIYTGGPRIVRKFVPNFLRTI